MQRLGTRFIDGFRINPSRSLATNEDILALARPTPTTKAVVQFPCCAAGCAPLLRNAAIGPA
jgi:hypothetical protein